MNAMPAASSELERSAAEQAVARPADGRLAWPLAVVVIGSLCLLLWAGLIALVIVLLR